MLSSPVAHGYSGLIPRHLTTLIHVHQVLGGHCSLVLHLINVVKFVLIAILVLGLNFCY